MPQAELFTCWLLLLAHRLMLYLDSKLITSHCRICEN